MIFYLISGSHDQKSENQRLSDYTDQCLVSLCQILKQSAKRKGRSSKKEIDDGQTDGRKDAHRRPISKGDRE